MLHGQYNDWLNDLVLHRTVIPYSRAWNRALTAQMHSRLPREVRDMIYGYLWYFDPKRTSLHDVGTRRLRQYHDFQCSPGATDVIQIHGLLLDLAQNLYRGSSHNSTELCDKSALPHHISPAHVGLEMAKEIGISFYHTVNLAGLLQCGAESIRSVMNKDCFDLGLLTTDLIRTLTVHCKMDRYRAPRPCCKPAITCQHTASEIGHVRKSALEMDFGAFFDIKDKQDFKLHIILYQRSIRMEVLAEVIEALASVVQHLKQHGACVTVSWTYRGRWEKYNRQPPRRGLVDRDITDFFDLPWSLWVYNMRKTYNAVCNHWVHTTNRNNCR